MGSPRLIPQAVLDASCGSGLFTRRFLTCGEFSKVFALDFSENMLKQTRQGIDKEPELQQKAVELDLELVRADIARLPFASESLSAVHAGAAIHCWPQPSLAMSEIARVLKPGGRAVLSTFMVPGQVHAGRALLLVWTRTRGRGGAVKVGCNP